MIHIRALQQEDDFRDLITLSRDFFQEYEAHHYRLLRALWISAAIHDDDRCE
jgi:hypothetical protein